MPVLARPRHEAFAQALFKGLANGITQDQAWQEAGYQSAPGNSSRVNASRALHKSGVIERVRELQAQAAARKGITVDSIVEELESARKLAQSIEQPSAMVSASATKAKILGLEIQRAEIGKPGDFSAVNTTADLAESLLKQLLPNKPISDVMRQQAIAELQRHALALQAITSEPNTTQ